MKYVVGLFRLHSVYNSTGNVIYWWGKKHLTQNLPYNLIKENNQTTP